MRAQSLDEQRPQMKRLIFNIFEKADVLLFPFVYIASLLLKYVRRVGVHKMPHCKGALMTAGARKVEIHVSLVRKRDRLLDIRVHPS